MAVENTLGEGDLDSTLTQLKQQIRQDPANPKLRVFLFQILAIQGNWQSAVTQLDVLKEMDASAIPMVQTYRELIRCEVFREGVFSGQRQPLIFGQPEQWIAWLVEALKHEVSGAFEQAEQLRAQAFEQAPVSPGNINGHDFNWLADADSRLGPVLEAVINGRYYWVPIAHIKQIKIEEPEDLRDLVWLPTHFVWSNEGDTIGFLPSRYPDSQHSNDTKINLAGKTEWLQKSEQTFYGLGQRLLTTDTDEYPLLDIREIELL